VGSNFLGDKVAEAERIKPRSLYVEEAIAAALESRWSEALSINRAMAEKHGTDEDTYNRLGKALTELGKHQEALESYQQTLELNPLNIIAQKNVRKLQLALASKERVGGSSGAIDVDLFAEEPGKSALSVLTPPRSGVIIAVAPGDVVELHPGRTGLQAQTGRGVVLGDVDNKIARRLLPLMATGNKYSAAVARVDEREIEVIIREAHQSAENARKSSFPISRAKSAAEFRPYAKDSLLASRGIESDTMEPETDEVPTEEDAAGDSRALTDDVEEAAPLEEAEEKDDDSDEDKRPEDEY
jgi:tetratricopeptide (TPR) repeat protein